MKDLIKRILISSISGVLLWYLAFLFLQKTVIVQTWFLEYNYVYYIILALICVYLFIFFGIYPVYLKITKATVFVAWIALIIIGDTVLLNDATTHVYISDLFKFIGVVLTLLAWSNVLITDKVKKQRKDSKIEVIEV